MKRNYDDFAFAEELLTNQEITGDGTEKSATAVDFKGVTKGVLIVHAGVFAAATTLSYQLQTSYDNSTWSDVFDADKTILTAADEDLQAYEVDGIGRYLRIQYTVTNAKTAILGFSFVGWDAVTQPLS